MDSQWAQQHLEVIRTLMERSAVYRRALAPTALLVGGLGVVAALAGFGLRIGSPRGFGVYWMAVAMAGLAGAYLVMRRQALRDLEPFWSPPARRVTQALLPAMFAGGVAGAVAVYPAWREPLQVWWLPAVWMILYGCALHAAGFFMPRGIRLFGWLFVLSGCALLMVLNERSYGAGMPALELAHAVMGLAFGGFHLGYGTYLLATRSSGSAA